MKITEMVFKKSAERASKDKCQKKLGKCECLAEIHVLKSG